MHAKSAAFLLRRLVSSAKHYNSKKRNLKVANIGEIALVKSSLIINTKEHQMKKKTCLKENWKNGFLYLIRKNLQFLAPRQDYLSVNKSHSLLLVRELNNKLCIAGDLVSYKL